MAMPTAATAAASHAPRDHDAMSATAVVIAMNNGIVVPANAGTQAIRRNSIPCCSFIFGLAIAAKVLPRDATAISHPRERAQFKACALGVQYGMGAATLARQLNWHEQRSIGLLA